MRRRFERNGPPRNGNGHPHVPDASEAPQEPEFEVIRHSIGGMHWYEQIVRETKAHLDWWKSVSHVTSRGRPMPPALLNLYAEKGAAEAERLKTQRTAAFDRFYQLCRELGYVPESAVKTTKYCEILEHTKEGS